MVKVEDDTQMEIDSIASAFQLSFLATQNLF